MSRVETPPSMKRGIFTPGPPQRAATSGHEKSGLQRSRQALFSGEQDYDMSIGNDDPEWPSVIVSNGRNSRSHKKVDDPTTTVSISARSMIGIVLLNGRTIAFIQGFPARTRPWLVGATPRHPVG